MLFLFSSQKMFLSHGVSGGESGNATATTGRSASVVGHMSPVRTKNGRLCVVVSDTPILPCEDRNQRNNGSTGPMKNQYDGSKGIVPGVVNNSIGRLQQRSYAKTNSVTSTTNKKLNQFFMPITFDNDEISDTAKATENKKTTNILEEEPTYDTTGFSKKNDDATDSRYVATMRAVTDSRNQLTSLEPGNGGLPTNTNERNDIEQNNENVLGYQAASTGNPHRQYRMVQTARVRD
jgi:hypothetical protein